MNEPSALAPQIVNASELYVRQKRELAELFGFESRNKYAISTSQKEEVAFAAEQQKGFLGAIFRQVLGHWRTFDISFFNAARQPMFRAHHPFRFFFQRLDIFDGGDRLIGSLQQRWAFFSKKFDVLDANGALLFEMNSGFLSFWTFPFIRKGLTEAVIEKKWSGALTELFTDKDNFRVKFLNQQLNSTERTLILAAAIFVDLQYFENKAGNNNSLSGMLGD